MLRSDPYGFPLKKSNNLDICVFLQKKCKKILQIAQHILLIIHLQICENSVILIVNLEDYLCLPAVFMSR